MSKIERHGGGMMRDRKAKAEPRARSKIASITTVAERAGVSIATVSRIVNGIAKKASPETVAKVQRAIAELGYRPVSVGRALRLRESRIVAVLAANLSNPTMAAIAASAESALRQAGYVMVLCDTHDRADLQDEYLLEMRALLVRGIVMLAAVSSPGLDDFVQAKEPILFVNRRGPGSRTSFVGVDNKQAGSEVAAHLLKLGVTQTAVIHGSLGSSATAERLAGFLEAMASAGHRLAPHHVRTAEVSDHLMIGLNATRSLLEFGSPPHGLFCLSDLIAYGAHKALQEAGLSSPEEVRVIGFDDNPLNNWLAPWLTSVKVPYREYGTAILEGLETIWSGAPPRHVLLRHHLIVRMAGANPE